MSDVSSVFIWWLTIFVLGLVFLPITFSLFHRFADRGYIFSKVIGILLASYTVWLLGSFHILPFTKVTLIIVLLGWTLTNLWLFKGLNQNNSTHKLPLGLIILEELLFLGGISFWAYVRASEPSIRGLEKFMDFGFVNSILRSNFFPPLDMWLTKSPDYTGGFFINYYYFGHYITAFLTKLSGIDSAITYNLMLATLFAFTFTLPFSIGMNLYYLFQSITGIKGTTSTTGSKNYQARDTRDTSDTRGTSLKLIIVGLLAAFIVALGGNPHTLYAFTAGYPNENPVPPWQLELGFHPERYWYPNATRFIPFTIHEFPIYSFVVADIHGHVFDIPFVLLTLALLFTLVLPRPVQDTREAKSNSSSLARLLGEFEKQTSIPLPIIILLGVLLAAMYMTNAWDGIIYMGLSGLVFLYRNLTYKNEGVLLSVRQSLYKTFSASLFLLFFFLIANLPFTLNFKPFVSGVGVLCAPKFLLDKTIGPFLFETGKCQKSPLYMLLILWGFFYWNVFGYLGLVIFPKIKEAYFSLNQRFKPADTYSWIKNLCEKLKRIKSSFATLRELTPPDIFVLMMIFISTLLLIFPEFFYIKDIYPAHYRANTMFKLGYQAFMMLGLVSSYIYARVRQIRIKNSKLSIYKLLFLILFFLVAIYPYFAINSYYGGLRTYHGIYGLNWLANQYPDDYQAIVWLRKNIQCGSVAEEQCNNQPVIVEANGESYTDYARVSANTGLPTIVGWPVHEWLWRGSYDEAGKRIPEVATIYESTDIEATKEILRKYKAEYIFLGTLEREKYKNLDEEKLFKLGRVIFESGNTKIIKVRQEI